MLKEVVMELEGAAASACSADQSARLKQGTSRLDLELHIDCKVVRYSWDSFSKRDQQGRVGNKEVEGIVLSGGKVDHLL